MPWPGSSLPIALLLLVATVGPPGVLAEGNVGCLFSERLCFEEEWCYDDYAFGRCLQAAGDVDEDDLYRYNLEREYLHVISSELRRLFALGYRWSHAYTQCRLQAILYATKHDLPFDSDGCSHLVDQDLEGALNALESQSALDPSEVAIIKYTPSVDNPHADFADEIYYPPIDQVQQAARERILPQNGIDILDMEDPYAQYAEIAKREWIPQMHRRSLKHNPDVNLEFIPPGPPQEDQLTFADLEKLYPLIKYFKDKDIYEEQAMEDEVSDDPYERFTTKYNTPEGFRKGWESRDSLPEDYLQEPRIYGESEDDNENNNEEYGSGYNTIPEVYRELQNVNDNREMLRELENSQGANSGGIYTEGGMVYAPNFDTDAGRNMDEFLANYNMGFKRPERLDVKKPGPPFEAKVYDDKRAIPGKHPKHKDQDPKFAQPEYLVDTDYVYVEFENNTIHQWAQGNQIIRNISQLLNLDSRAFTHGRVDHNEVTFKVDPVYARGLNASQIIKKIDEIRDDFKLLTGIEIIEFGIGDKTKLRASFVSKTLNNNEFYVIIFTICGILGAMIIAAGLLIIIKRHLKTKEKLQGLSRPDTEASKDYQELCRARMAAKGQQERITSLSRESEQSPSSRSSTSSWSEEPALHNMDISTGHMVLSYMEDHLKNKDRLEQEWVALCAYLAEPCETTIALKKDNIEKNRYKDIVPYDHARVVLNELSNATGSDYINASSITDHDPRNPAYIATQGPLPHTAPDFWQLIWEQGAVVIVMLSRLTEGGTAMCHRYWPEEGSELYHIYEVHLVSEHIWCDDYLVRSFYLKNIRTGETRTVTQFHFLSWPESGVPSSTKALLEFRRKVNKSYRGRSCPIVVHCSDGAGRTGTYCLIDMVLSRMAKGAKEIDIAATLEHLRDQRLRMVATKQQFEFVLTAVAEEVHAILKALPPQPTTQTDNKDKQ